MPPLETPTLRSKSGSVSCGVTAPFSWVLMCAWFCLCPPRVCYPSLWQFCNQTPLAIKVKFPGGSQSLDAQVGKSVVGPRTFTTTQELLWYNCSPVCGLFPQWLCGGAHILCLPGLLQPEPLSLQQATADLCLCRRHSDIQRQVWLSLLWGPWVLVHTRFCLSPLSVSGMCGV